MVARKINGLTYDIVSTSLVGEPVYSVQIGDRIVGYLKDKGITEVWGYMRADNLQMGFIFDPLDPGFTATFKKLALSDQDNPVKASRLPG